MSTHIRYYFLFALFIFSAHSYAVDYTWKSNSFPTQVFNQPSAKAACDALWVIRAPAYPTYRWDGLVEFTSGGNSAVCHMTTISTGSTSANFGSLQRTGTTCTAPAVYDSATYSCITPQQDPCTSKAGQSTQHEHRIGDLDNLAVRFEPPGTICENSCQYAFSYEAPTIAYRYVDNSHPNAAFASFRYQANGISCTTGPAAQPPSKAPTDLTPQQLKTSACSDFVNNPDGSGTRTCNSSDLFKDPGKMNCADGSVPGAFVCTPAVPPPAYKKTDVTQTTTNKDNADGSKTTTTVENTTTTSCYGVNACSTTNKTTTITGGTNANGTPAASTSDCKGAGCTGSTNTDPSKDPEEDKKPERIATGGGSCEAAAPCSGDAIDCAMLAEQHKARCDAKEAGDFPKHKTEIEGLLTGDKFNLQADEQINAESFINAGTRFLPASCPADTNFSLSFSGGHSFALSYSPFCFFAEALSPLIVIAATVFAALYVGRAFGGE